MGGAQYRGRGVARGLRAELKMQQGACAAANAQRISVRAHLIATGRFGK